MKDPKENVPNEEPKIVTLGDLSDDPIETGEGQEGGNPKPENEPEGGNPPTNPVEGNEEGKETKTESFNTNDLVKKAQAEGVEALSKEEKEHLRTENLLVTEEEANANDPETNSEFQSSIEAITGIELDVDLGETPIDTPQGLAKYIDEFAKNRIIDFEENLKNKFPRAYEALLIEAEGGDVTKYFSSQQVNDIDYSKVELSESDNNQYKNIIRNSYKLKGVDDETIEEVIKLAEDTNKLKAKAQPELNYLKESQKAKVGNYAKEVELKNQENLRVRQSMINTIDGLIDNGTIGNFTIPKADKQQFSNHLKGNVQFKDGKFFLTKEVTPESLEQIAQAEFFDFKKGNLSKYIKREADTKLVLRLKDNAKADKLNIANEDGRLKDYIPLGEI